MDQAETALLYLETMGPQRLPETTSSGCRPMDGVEHGEIRTRSLAVKQEPGALQGIAEPILCWLGIAIIGNVLRNEEMNRRGTCPVCPVVSEERSCEVPPYPD